MDLDKFDSSDGESEGQNGAGQQSLAAVIIPQEAETGPPGSIRPKDDSAVELASGAIAPAETPMDDSDPQTSIDDSGSDYSSSLKMTATPDSVTRFDFGTFDQAAAVLHANKHDLDSGANGHQDLHWIYARHLVLSSL